MVERIRLWLRDWLNAPSAAERARVDALREPMTSARFREVAKELGLPPLTGDGRPN